MRYQGTHRKVEILCKQHGSFWQTPANHISGGYGCWYCGQQRAREAKRRRLADLFIKRATDVHDDFFDYSEVAYVSAKTKIRIICPHHGVFEQFPYSHLAGTGCPACWKDRKHLAKRHTKEDFLDNARRVHGPAYNYTDVVYRGIHRPVIIRCNTCNRKFSQKPSNHIHGRNGCPHCAKNNSISKAETQWLDSLGVPERQYSITLPNGKKTKVDGFDPETNTVYSFLGSFWHADPRVLDPEDTHPVIGKPNREIHQETMERLAAIQASGFHVVMVWEEDLA